MPREVGQLQDRLREWVHLLVTALAIPTINLAGRSFRLHEQPVVDLGLRRTRNPRHIFHPGDDGPPIMLLLPDDEGAVVGTRPAGPVEYGKLKRVLATKRFHALPIVDRGESGYKTRSRPAPRATPRE